MLIAPRSRKIRTEMATRCSNVKVIGNLGEGSFGAMLGGQRLMGIDLKKMRRGTGERKKKQEFGCKESKELNGYLAREIRTRESLHF